MSLFTDTFMYGFASLFAVVNPVGMSAVFLSMTKDLPLEVQHKGAYRVAIYGTFLLLATFFVGPWLLRFFWNFRGQYASGWGAFSLFHGVECF